MSSQPHHHEGIKVRSYHPQDQTAIARLYSEGLLAGQIASNDTGADIENVQEAYFADPASHLWVAEREGKVVGMIGVAREEGETAEVRRLRVDKAHQNSPIGAMLVEIAIAHCRHHGYLKVVLDTRFERDAVLDVFTRFGFQHNRTRNVQGKELLEFYLDLYRAEKPENAR